MAVLLILGGGQVLRRVVGKLFGTQIENTVYVWEEHKNVGERT